MSQPEFQETLLDLPPCPVIRMLPQYMEPRPGQVIADYGCYSGRNSLFLAQYGHKVVGIDIEIEGLHQAQEIAEVSSNAGSMFVVADANRPILRAQSVDVVLCNEMLYQLTNRKAVDVVLSEIKDITKVGGLNAISSYLALPGEIRPDSQRFFFAPEELSSMYEDPNWKLVFYEESYVPPQYDNGVQRVSARADLIAQKVK